MKRLFPVMVVSALLVTFGFAQIPDTGSNTGSANVKGCLGGSDGSYTVAEDGTRQIFKVTTSSVDLKPHLGHDVALIGHKAGGAVSSGAADNSFAVTELSMISEHCAGAAAVPAATVIPLSETVVAPAAAATVTASTPAADVAATATTVNPSAATVSIPVVDAAVPATASTPAADTAAAATVNPSAATASIPVVDAAVPATASTPAADTAAAAMVNPSAAAVSVPATSAVDAAAAPDATVSTPAVDTAAPASPSSATTIKPAADAVHPTRLSAHPHKPSTKQAAAATTHATTVSPSSDAVVPTAADAGTPSATVNPSDAVSTPVPATTAPKATRRGSFWLLVAFVVLVVLLGTLAPLFGRWRKRRMLERTGTPNLAFTNAASSDLEKPEARKVA